MRGASGTRSCGWRPRRLAGAAVGLAALGPLTAGAPAVAASTVTVSTAQRPLDVPDSSAVEPYTGYNQGWWAEHEGHDGDGYDNPNYATGYSMPYDETRSFFTFYVGGVDRRVTAATMRVPRGCATSPDASERVRFYDVSTPARELVTGTAPSASTFEDLGSGVLYAQNDVSTAGGGAVLDIRLNARALEALNRARGRDYFSVGAAVSTLSSTGQDETVFGCTGRRAVALVLTTR